MPYKQYSDEVAAKRRYYMRSKQAIVDRTRQKRAEIRKWLIDYKTERGCKECGNKHPAVLDFHHTGGRKERGLTECANSQFSQQRLEEEIAKCIILCSNCHRISHWNLTHGA